MTVGRALALLLAVAVALGGCAPSSGSAAGDDRRLTVLAAASLRQVFDELAAKFEASHPGVEVIVSYGGSADLADQVLSGAPADVLATADERTMARVEEGGDAAEPVVFATNTLTVVTPPDDPAGVASLADLARDDVDVVVCAPEVPCGAATDEVAQGAGVTIHRVSEEPSVTDVLAKITAGEADAGLVYVTDAALAGDGVRVVATPEAEAAVNRYPVAVLTGAGQPDLARDWVELVTDEAGRDVLAGAGFGLP